VRAGRGPIFIECKTLRAQEHSVGGVNNEGIMPRDPALMRAWREERDPERLAGVRLLEAGVLTEGELDAMHAAADREAENLAAACEALPKALPSIDELQSAVYS
jgi:TPP-dependent pyruvate/acetoin dehydrogenase alpha subunit